MIKLTGFEFKQKINQSAFKVSAEDENKERANNAQP